MTRVLSGTKPTGDQLHLGNYFGALRQYVTLQDRYDEALYFIADYHSMTSVRDATIELAQAEGALARTEADLRYSIGVSGTEGRGTQARAIDILMQSTSLQTPPDEEDAPIPRKPVPATR